MTRDKAAKEICKILFYRGYVKGTSGNASYIDNDERRTWKMITVSGLPLSRAEFVNISNQDGSSDADIHKAMYRLAPVQCIFHIHEEGISASDFKPEPIVWEVKGHGSWIGFLNEPEEVLNQIQ